MKGVIKHYRWSWVGNLLFDLPGVEYQDVSINEDEVVKDNGDLKAIFWRHDTKYLKYDENGNLMPGEKMDLRALLLL